MKYSFHAPAARELAEACQFYREQGGPALARSFIDEIERVARLLVANPGFGKPTGAVAAEAVSLRPITSATVGSSR